MITCETTNQLWTVEGKIENLPGSYGGEGAHVGIDDLSNLLAEHVGKWAKVRVELIEGPGYVVAKENPWPRPRPIEGSRPSHIAVPPGTGENCITDGCKAVATLGWHCAEHHVAFIEEHRRRAASTVTVVDELKRLRSLATKVRELMATMRTHPAYKLTLEQQCIETLSVTVLALGDQIEDIDRRLQSLEGGK